MADIALDKNFKNLSDIKVLSNRMEKSLDQFVDLFNQNNTNVSNQFNSVATSIAPIPAMQSAIQTLDSQLASLSILSLVDIPEDPGSPGTVGQLAIDPIAKLVYICYTTNAWGVWPFATSFSNAINLSYVSAGDANGLFNYLTTHSISYTAGVTNSFGLPNGYPNSATPQSVTLYTNTLEYAGVYPYISDNRFIFDLTSTKTFKLRGIYYRGTYSTLPVYGYNPFPVNPIIIYGSNDLSSWFTFATITTGLVGGGTAKYFDLSADPLSHVAYRYFMIHTIAPGPSNNVAVALNIELYGVLYPP